MQLNIQKVTPETVEVQGQTVTRAYAEGIMLSGLIAGAGRNDAAKHAIVTQYLDAGLSANAFPDVVRMVRAANAQAQREREERQAEADAHAERFKSYESATPLNIARRRAAREAREAKYRSMGAALRQKSGRGDFSSENWLDNQ